MGSFAGELKEAHNDPLNSSGKPKVVVPKLKLDTLHTTMQHHPNFPLISPHTISQQSNNNNAMMLNYNLQKVKSLKPLNNQDNNNNNTTSFSMSAEALHSQNTIANILH